MTEKNIITVKICKDPKLLESTKTIPYDDTILQNTECYKEVTRSFTPLSKEFSINHVNFKNNDFFITEK